MRYNFYFEHEHKLLEDSAVCSNSQQAHRYMVQIAEARGWTPIMWERSAEC